MFAIYATWKLWKVSWNLSEVQQIRLGKYITLILTSPTDSEVWKSRIINSFNSTGLFLYPQKTSENQSFSDASRGYMEKPSTMKCVNTECNLWICSEFDPAVTQPLYVTKYSRMDQVKFVEDRFQTNFTLIILEYFAPYNGRETFI